MGCFCRNLLPMPPAIHADAALDVTLTLPPTDPMVAALGTWLSARWLPAAPWRPDPAWLDIEWPAVPIPSAALSVLVSLLVATDRIRLTLGIDLADPRGVERLARIVATLDARLPALAAALETDAQPWLSLLQLDAQVAMVRSAIAMNLFAVDVQPGIDPVGPWRAMLLRVKALSPLVAIGQMLKLDWSAPDATDRLAAQVRLLARIRLPALSDMALVLRLVGRLDALVRLQASLGLDPRTRSFAQVRAAVLLRAERAVALLPPHIRLEAGHLVGMPALPPNPGLVLDAGTIMLARQITPGVLARLNWQVPAFDQLAVLTVGLPVATLAGSLAALGVDPIRQSPCGPACDAAQVMRALAAA